MALALLPDLNNHLQGVLVDVQELVLGKVKRVEAVPECRAIKVLV